MPHPERLPFLILVLVAVIAACIWGYRRNRMLEKQAERRRKFMTPEQIAARELEKELEKTYDWTWP